MKISLGRMFLITFWVALATLLLWPVLQEPAWYEIGFCWLYYLMDWEPVGIAMAPTIATLVSGVLGLFLLALQAIIAITIFVGLNVEAYNATKFKR